MIIAKKNISTIIQSDDLFIIERSSPHPDILLGLYESPSGITYKDKMNMGYDRILNEYKDASLKHINVSEFHHIEFVADYRRYLREHSLVRGQHRVPEKSGPVVVTGSTGGGGKK